MAMFLVLFVVAIALLLVGIAIKGLFWLAILGIIVFLLSVAYGASVAPRTR